MKNIDRILRPKEVCEVLSISKATLWRKEQRGELPPKKRISAGAVGWMRSDIESMLEGSDAKSAEAQK